MLVDYKHQEKGTDILVFKDTMKVHGKVAIKVHVFGTSALNRSSTALPWNTAWSLGWSQRVDEAAKKQDGQCT